MHNGDYSKVFLGGSSQGCCITYFAAMTLEQVIGGVIGMSGVIFPLLKQIVFNASEDNRVKWKISMKAESLPILHYHGGADPLFNIETVRVNLDEFWIKLGFSNFNIEVEEGLGHIMTKVGLKRVILFLE